MILILQQWLPWSSSCSWCSHASIIHSLYMVKTLQWDRFTSCNNVYSIYYLSNSICTSKISPSTLINILAKYANYVMCSNFSPFIFNLELFTPLSFLNRKTDIFLSGYLSPINGGCSLTLFFWSLYTHLHNIFSTAFNQNIAQFYPKHILDSSIVTIHSFYIHTQQLDDASSYLTYVFIHT